MKLFVIITVVLFIISSSALYGQSAVGSSFGTMATASSVGMGHGDFVAGIGLGDNITAFSGALSYGLSKYTDGRIKLALVDPDGGSTSLAIGADIKWQFWELSPNTQHPFNFAVGGMTEYADLNGVNVFQVGGFLLGSYPVPMSNNSILTPYARFNARLESLDYDALKDDSNLEIGLNAGVEWTMTTTVKLFSEIQLDGNDGIFFGVSFSIM